MKVTEPRAGVRVGIAEPGDPPQTIPVDTVAEAQARLLAAVAVIEQQHPTEFASELAAEKAKLATVAPAVEQEPDV